MTTLPPGFSLLGNSEGFIDHAGPYYIKRGDGTDGALAFGFQSDARHRNMNGVFHGGALLTFLDTVLGYIVVEKIGKPCATVTFESKFVAGVAPGNWITARVRIRAMTRTLAFTEGEAMDGDKLLVTATGVFRIFG